MNWHFHHPRGSPAPGPTLVQEYNTYVQSSGVVATCRIDIAYGRLARRKFCLLCCCAYNRGVLRAHCVLGSWRRVRGYDLLVKA